MILESYKAEQKNRELNKGDMQSRKILGFFPPRNEILQQVFRLMQVIW